MVKGMGVVDQALREAFQILKQVLQGKAEGQREETGWKCGRGRFIARSHGAPSSAQFQEARQGSLCNQAIMLITDGAMEDYEPVFEKYNWPDRKVLPAGGRGVKGEGGGGGQGEWSPTAMMHGPEKPGLPRVQIVYPLAH